MSAVAEAMPDAAPPPHPEVLSVGRISVDLYCGEANAGWLQARTFTRAAGGSPTNVAVAAARLGHHAAVYTNVGADPFGEVALAELRAFGVDTSFIRTVADALTPLAFAVLDPPDEPRLHFRRSPPVPDLLLRAEDPAVSAAERVPLLWVSGGALSAEPSASTTELLLRSRSRRAHTVLDLDYRASFWRSRAEASARIGAAVAHATVVVGNREECAIATGAADPYEAARLLLGRGVGLAVVKLGAGGVLMADAERELLLPSQPIDVVCGLGAGDGFGGAIAHGLLKGWTHERTVSFANAAGAIVASRLLCSDAMPAEDEVMDLMARSGQGRPWP